MAKKLTIDFVREQFLAKDCELLSKVYINAKQHLKYKCKKCGYTGTRTYSSLKWRGCPFCSNRLKYTIKFIKKEFLKKDFELLSTTYIDNNQKLKYRCKNCGYIGLKCYSSLQQGNGCPKCAQCLKYTIEFIRKEFLNRNFKLLSNKYVSNKQNLEYKCLKCGYTGVKRYDCLIAGSGCPGCYRLGMLGDGNQNWNPILTDEDRRKTRPAECKIWAKQVKKRDNNTCQICGDKKGGNLVSHHLESYNSNPELRIELSNGVCLCEECHNNFHNRYGRGNNTRKQFEEFLKNQDIRN